MPRHEAKSPERASNGKQNDSGVTHRERRESEAPILPPNGHGDDADEREATDVESAMRKFERGPLQRWQTNQSGRPIRNPDFVRAQQRWEANDNHEVANGTPDDIAAAARGQQPADVRLSLKGRVKHFTWTWFTMTMATGGIANVLHTVPEPYRFHGIWAIGCFFYLLNIALFLFNVAMIGLRFYFHPSTFRASLTHPIESLFPAAFVISFGTILLNTSQYGVDSTGEWLTRAMIVMFWFECGVSILFTTAIFLVIWSETSYTLAQMTPVWIFPVYPLLIVGPHAGQLAPKVSPHAALDIIVGGFVIQGIGFMVSFMVYSAYLYRLMTQKLPANYMRPGMFISVGPSGFTISGVVSMARVLPDVVPRDFMMPGAGKLVAQVTVIVANWMGLWLWGLALWFFLVSVGAHCRLARRGGMNFAMTWFSFVFPNTALTTATFWVARALNDNRAIQILGLVMTVGLIIAWLFVVVCMIRAVSTRQLLWPQKQEDRDMDV